MPTVVVSDFDNTIVDADTGELILMKLADGDWEYYQRMYDSMEMTVEEALTHQFAMVKASKKEILAAVEGVKVRAGFRELVGECLRRHVPLEVASYGLDFYIRKILDRIPGTDAVRVHSPRVKVTPGGVFYDFPRPLGGASTNVKLKRVMYHKSRGARVVFIGDGTSDLPGIQEADVRFAIKGSRLARLCEERGTSCEEISSFYPVIEALPNL